MSKNIKQVFDTNPITSNAATDLMYFGESPYGVTDDAAMLFSNFAAQFGAPYTPAALSKTNDTNVTLTLGGTPLTALLQSVSLTLGWTGVLSGTRGGTGVNNGASLITIGANFTMSGAFAFTGTLTGITTVTFPTSGTLATTSQLPTPAALTKVDDTNVTLTLGGTPATALLQATSLTLGWTGLLSGTRGGTGVNNGASLITVGGNFTMSGAFAFTGTLTGTTTVTFPTSGTLATTSQIPTGAALTKTDDTNVTLTLGGSPTTALVNAASLTLGWTGQLGETRGGTNQATYTLGDILYASASNTLAKLAGNITTTKQYLSQTGNGAVSAAPSWATIAGSDITGAALIKTDDTNVTLTLGGTPTTALLRAASLTLGWTGQLGLTRGGTAASLTADNGGIVYSTASALAILASTSTARRMLLSQSSTAPIWSTETIAAPGASGNALISDGTNWTSAAISVAVGNITGLGTGVATWLATPSSANLLSAMTTKTGTGNLVFATSPTLVTPILGVATATSLAFSPTTGGIIGTATNDSVAAGTVGEIVTAQVTAASATAIGVASANPTDVTSISLTAGQWLVIGNAGVTFNASTGQVVVAWISTTSATLPDASLRSGVSMGTVNTLNTVQVTAPSRILQLSGTTTVYLSLQASFSSTATKYGQITATRMR